MIDLNIDFFKPQEKTIEHTIEIIPVSCISVAEKISSSFIDFSKVISDNKIYGMLENILDLQCPPNIRAELKTILNSKKKCTEDQKRNLAYFPIIDDICEITHKPELKIISSFIDLVSTLYSDSDKRHVNGSRIYDAEIQNMSPQERITKLGYFDSAKYKVKDSTLTPEIREERKRLFPLFPRYYTGTSKRKYAFVEPFQIKIKVTEELSELLKEKIVVNSSAYLGNSDSLINLKLIQ